MNIISTISRCTFLLISLPIFVFAQGRKVVPFNEQWQFHKTDSTGRLPVGPWEPVTLPHTWNNHDMQIAGGFYTGEASYQKQFTPDSAWKKGCVFLRFEGIGDVAEVYLNKKLVGTHKGGYSAFCVDLSYALRYDTLNTLLVKVSNRARQDVIPINHFLFGVYGGIYRPAALIITDKIHITTQDYASSGIYIFQSQVTKQKATINVKSKLENREQQPALLTLATTIVDAAGKKVASRQQKLTLSTQGVQIFTQSLTLPHPNLWQAKKDPYLYSIIVSLYAGNRLLDAVAQPLGVRTFGIWPGKGFYLNGKPYRLYGVARHQDWWASGSALSNAQHDTDLALINEIGATSIRFSHYQQAEHIYSKCDSMGFVVWAEIPFVNAVSGQEADNAKQQLTELIRQNFNHPSIYVWGLHNEVYCKTPADYAAVLTRTLNDIAKTEDPDRYTVSTNGYGIMEHPINGNADIQAMNRYYGWYEGKTADLQNWVTSLEKHYPQNRVMLSEYGAEANIDQQTDTLPESIDPLGQYFPEAAQARSHEIQWGIIAKHPYLAASYVWNMFDFGTPMWNRGGVSSRNMKGLVSFDRKVRKDAFFWYKANWNPAPMVYIADRRAIHRTKENTIVTVYANVDKVELFVNGQKQEHPQKGATIVHYLFPQVLLQKGVNHIKVTGQRAGHIYTDEVIWTLD